MKRLFKPPSRTIEHRRGGILLHEGGPPVIIRASIEGMAFRYKTVPSVPNESWPLDLVCDHGAEAAKQ